MTILTYATSSDYANWTGGTSPANVDTLLRSASMVMRRATRTALYAVDDTGAPTDTAFAAAFRDATCAQAAALAANNIDPLAGPGGDLGMVQSTSIGTASIAFVTDPATADLRRSLLTDPCPEAAEILAAAGLNNQAPAIGRTGP